VPQSPSLAVSLPRFRIINLWDPIAAPCGLPREQVRVSNFSLGRCRPTKFAGRSDKIFVVVEKEMIANGKAEAILQSFTDYEFENWRRTNLDGMVIYTQ
jgi:hypothetical protein